MYYKTNISNVFDFTLTLISNMNSITNNIVCNFVALELICMDNIEALLKERGLTKTAFSDLLGIKKQNLNGLMKNPTLETIKKFASVLGVDTWMLFADHKKVKSSEGSILCPHCGGEIHIKVE